VELLSPLGRGPDSAYVSDGRLHTPANWACAYGYSLLPRSVSNLLPPDYVHEQEAEFHSLLWRSATGTALAVSLILSGAEYYRGALALERARNLATRLSETQARLVGLGGPRIEATLAANQRWLAAVARKDVRSADVLRRLAAETPASIAIDRLDVTPSDSGHMQIELSGEVRTPHEQDEVELADFVDRLQRSGWFYQVTLDNFATNRKPDYEQLLFQITMRAPLEERRP
jgi:hypothetical protein